MTASGSKLAARPGFPQLCGTTKKLLFPSGHGWDMWLERVMEARNSE